MPIYQEGTCGHVAEAQVNLCRKHGVTILQTQELTEGSMFPRLPSVGFNDHSGILFKFKQSYNQTSAYIPLMGCQSTIADLLLAGLFVFEASAISGL